ncbi:ABC transporter permease [Actinoalloteichus hymeniacidonis]|uniref:ABC-type multidrug transport system, permease component n=1 Tax=Actinoalloteichus hymeniacidonis TaxID=340345 RepID=A0AAC9HMI1_9PSEU|nr:ABC transporter permease [Actinoalloteichus hymeniacidonis]AOS61975.1 ABC-type multidrug transport system, permease component [Actinoalloteichus hymeniacidonis]MBB5910003.1 ABC-2 type transport system permease protein [Actinoalloteichus hymeniacidonis]
MLRALLVVSGHELRTRLRDGTALLIALVAPVALASMFGFALGGDDPPLQATIGIVDLDGGQFPASVQSEALDSEELEGILTLEAFDSEDQARSALDEDAIGAAIVFPPGFSDSVGEGQGGEVDVMTSEAAPLAGVVATSMVDRISALVEARTLAVRASLDAGIPSDEVGEFVEANGADGPALTLSSDPMTGGSIDSAVYYGSGMAVLFAFLVVGTSARSLLTERQNGTLSRIRAAPVPQWTAVAGKGIVGFGLALTSMCVTWGSSVLLFGSSWGDPLAVFALCAAHALAATAITMLIASGAKTDAQADGFNLGIAFVFAVLGGSLVPLYNLPDFLQTLALITPNGWASTGLSELAVSGGGIATVALPLAVIGGIALVTGALAALRFRKGLLG